MYRYHYYDTFDIEIIKSCKTIFLFYILYRLIGNIKEFIICIPKNSYCNYAKTLPKGDINRHYHDHVYGFRVNEDHILFERLILEINQAGLSWTTILKKVNNFRLAYNNFHIKTVANYQEKDYNRLLNTSGIIRNRLKIKASIYNAQAILKIQEKYGSFRSWLQYYQNTSLDNYIRIFRQHFKFTGSEITKEFLISTGYLEGAHDKNCPIYQVVYDHNKSILSKE